MGKKVNATESLWYNGVDKLCQPKCFIMSLSSWGPHFEL